LNQKWADRNLQWLLLTKASKRFVSCEPLLGSIDLVKAASVPVVWNERLFVTKSLKHLGLDLCIVGGESGSGARPMKLDWARSLVQQCKSANVPVFVKQMGTAWAKQDDWPKTVYQRGDTKGHEMKYWSEDLQVREMPEQER